MSLKIHDYFNLESTYWGITEFLNSCDIEPFDKKLDCYILNLQFIANNENGFRQEKAIHLLNQYKEGEDKIIARKWEYERSCNVNFTEITYGETVGEPSYSRMSLRKRSRINYTESSSSEAETDCDNKSKHQKVKIRSTQITNVSEDAEFQESVSTSLNDDDDGLKTPSPRPFKETKDITTPKKPKLIERSFQYLSKHILVNVNEQGLVNKGKRVAIIPIIPDETHNWLVNVLSSEKDRFFSAIMDSPNPEHRFQKICKIILYDFFSMTSEGPLERNIGERKYTTEQIVLIFKAISSVCKEYKFDWIEIQLRCIKDMKLLFSNFDLTLNKADGVCMKASNNQEIIFIEVSGGPEATVEKHVWEDTEKLIKEAMFGLVSLLRNYLDKDAMDAKNIRTYMVHVIGDRMTLSEIRLVKKHVYTVSQINSAVIPFSFNEVEMFLEIFELLYALLSGLEDLNNELKKLMFSKHIIDAPTVRDWIWIPESTAEWEAIEIV